MILELSAKETEAVQSALLGAVVYGRQMAERYRVAGDHATARVYEEHASRCSELVKRFGRSPSAVVEVE